MSSMADLAVVVVNYGSSALLARNLAPLTREHPELTAVVVDNFSTASERERLVELAAAQQWETVLLDENVGFGAGMNAGVARAIELGAGHVLLLNPDATIDADSLGLLLAGSRREPLTMLQPALYRPDGSVFDAGSDLYLRDGRIRSIRRRIGGEVVAPWLSGACLMVSVELWRLMGGFETAYFLYWEDVDLAWRVRRAGGAIRVEASARAVHAEGGTQGGAEHKRAGLPKSNLYYYYNIRNRMVFASLWLTPSDARRWWRSAVPVAWEVLLQGGRRQFLSTRAPLVAALRGLRDGARLSRAKRSRRP